MDMAHAHPSRKEMRRIATVYALGSKTVYWMYMFIFGLEHLMHKLGLHFLRPFKLFSKDAAWPQFIIENEEFDIILAVPAPERYIKQYESILDAVRQRESTAERAGTGVAR